MNENTGDLFGTVVTDKKGNVIVVTSNRVLETNIWANIKFRRCSKII